MSDASLRAVSVVSDVPSSVTPGRGVFWQGGPLIVLSSCAFAGMAVASRALAGTVPPGQLVFLRFVVGLLGTGGLFLWRRELPRSGRPWVLVGRGVFGGISVLLFFVALHELEVGPATLLNYSSSLFAALFGALFLGERVSARLGVGLGFATLGAGIVGYGSSPLGRPFELGWGVVAGAISAVFGGAAVASIRALRATTDALTIFFSFCAVGGLLALPFALQDWRPLDARAWGLALVVGVLSWVGQLLFTHAFGFVSATVGGAVNQLTPAVSWGLGVLLLGEHPSWLTTFGAVLCTGGVLLGSTAGLGGTARALPEESSGAPQAPSRPVPDVAAIPERR